MHRQKPIHHKGRLLFQVITCMYLGLFTISVLTSPTAAHFNDTSKVTETLSAAQHFKKDDQKERGQQDKTEHHQKAKKSKHPRTKDEAGSPDAKKDGGTPKQNGQKSKTQTNSDPEISGDNGNKRDKPGDKHHSSDNKDQGDERK